MTPKWGKISIKTVLTDQIDLILEKQKKNTTFVSGQADNPTQFVNMAVSEKIEKELKKK